MCAWTKLAIYTYTTVHFSVKYLGSEQSVLVSLAGASAVHIFLESCIRLGVARGGGFRGGCRRRGGPYLAITNQM